MKLEEIAETWHALPEYFFTAAFRLRFFLIPASSKGNA
jgi:hypothetical protein